ncbi:MAG TPA: DegQ family serine endoprotease [Thermodesulfobacteriota bacterium]|nr:DegQ family serine endoprotease [Thermodesulfobacteriota bacterium]
MRRFLLLVALIPFFLLIALTGCEKIKEENAAERSSEKTLTKENRDSETAGVKELPSFAGLIKKLEPSVVNISTTSVISRRGLPFPQFPSPFGEEDPFGEFFEKFFGEAPQQEFRQQGLGSGFIISEDGYVMTNNHVVDKAQDIQVILESGEKYEAKILGRDPKTDLALLKIEPKEKLQPVTFGNSDKLEIGDWVIAIGNPFGLGNTVTAGIVSAKGRVLGLGAYDDFIQTDAPINPGNSGGPLFNLNGEVVGVNTAIVTGGQGIGFAIPVNLAENIVKQLKDKGKVVRGWIGVMIQQITPEIAEGMDLKEAEGALVSDVTPGGPADKAGIRRGDIIVEFNGHEIKSISELTSRVALATPGTEVKLKIIRDGKEKDITAKLEELPETRAGKMEEGTGKETEEKLGLSAEEITPQIADRFNLEEGKGVIVTNVSPGSIADEAGFQQGDVILEINRQSIRNIDDYRSAMGNVEKGKSNLFLVKRGENTMYVAIRAG